MTTAHEVGRVPEIKIHHRFRIAREAAGMEQGELAKAIGVSRTSISNAELGKHTPRKIMVNAWAMATGVPVEWLETGRDPHSGGPNGGLESGALPHLDSNQKPAD
ncbi:helix-turn-helix transcriptional regulator [Nocardia farcinica]|uniref:Putative DNA-binding protein n=1 Tax=Nocardia farcinica (strain IFM 10152) TaxID=247156 RepID=Q5YZS4_NOCFA|nr:helix-turn-helix transcriptional regulator [Nocardia farcinica]MBF6291843.1 helix-turn-helix transcriptional regulator [Nocardia farcinica]MBF6573776.1 helix-turn-helix transcriptional regulator [Nocardia farcinica]BAD56317.1 putative DNA-binding protein [Nocardia farcinica IFM 10152]